MTTDLEQRYRRMAERGKYQGLYQYLCGMKAQEWQATFAEVESIIGFELPPSARDHRAWWANQSPALGHSYAAAWRAGRMGHLRGRYECGDACIQAKAPGGSHSVQYRRSAARFGHRMAGGVEVKPGRPLRRQDLASHSVRRHQYSCKRPHIYSTGPSHS